MVSWGGEILCTARQWRCCFRKRYLGFATYDSGPIVHPEATVAARHALPLPLRSSRRHSAGSLSETIPSLRLPRPLAPLLPVPESQTNTGPKPRPPHVPSRSILSVRPTQNPTVPDRTASCTTPSPHTFSRSRMAACPSPAKPVLLCPPTRGIGLNCLPACLPACLWLLLCIEIVEIAPFPPPHHRHRRPWPQTFCFEPTPEEEEEEDTAALVWGKCAHCLTSP